MSQFNFITDPEFRNSLEGDYSELRKCVEMGTFKSVHVLAGSIVEALLCDYLLDHAIITKAKSLNISLGSAISIAKENSIISERTASLSSVIQGYRNLIHPGRKIRLQESISNETSQIAKSVVDIIINDLAEKRKINYGFTAEQIVSKLERDASSKSIIPHLLEETQQAEIERLLVDLLPQAYLDSYNTDDEYFMSPHFSINYESCFKAGYEKLDEQRKKVVAKWFVHLIKEGGEDEVFTFGIGFFSASMLVNMSKNGQKIVKEYLIGNFANKISSSFITAMGGIGPFLENSDILPFVDPLVQLITSLNPLSSVAFSRIAFESNLASDEISLKITSRLDNWEVHLKEQNNHAMATKIQELSFKSTKVLPF